MQTSSSTALCHDWPLGKCSYGTNCVRQHPSALSPFSQKQIDYTVDKTPGTMCRRCKEMRRPCDKAGRGGLDDPCSECRHFGGDKISCELEEQSLNDKLWYQMLNRPREGYNLGDEKPRDFKRDDQDPGPQPMPAEKVKSNWQGESRVALMMKPPMLPKEVCDHPRAYLTPPRMSKAKAKSKAFKQQWGGSRASEGDVSGPLPLREAFHEPESLQMPTVPAALARPEGNEHWGEVIKTEYDWVTKLWTYTYESGAVVSGHPNTIVTLQSPQDSQ